VGKDLIATDLAALYWKSSCVSLAFTLAGGTWGWQAQWASVTESFGRSTAERTEVRGLRNVTTISMTGVPRLDVRY